MKRSRMPFRPPAASIVSVICVLALYGCTVGDRSSLTPPSRGEMIFNVGTRTAKSAPQPGMYVAHVVPAADSRATNAYVFPANVSIRRHFSSRQGEFIEFHGVDGATFIPAAQLQDIAVVDPSGRLRQIAIPASSTRAPSDCLANEGTARHTSTVNCYDPGPCVDCSGPMAPGGWLSCSIVSHQICGGDPTDGTGHGIGIFRSVDPLVSCQYDFSTGEYECDFDVDNSQSDAPADLSNGYEYNIPAHSALLHCKGPAVASTAFVVGKDPSRSVNVGFHNVAAGRSAGWLMYTDWAYNTSMNAQYFSLSLNAVKYVGWCAGSN
jgi:hypothetical protein